MFKIVDLFCGIGGFSYGFEMTQKFEVVVAADIWETAINTYKQNHKNKNAKIILTDLTKTTNKFWYKFKNDIDVIIAGPPCQGFSMSGKRDAKDKRNSLFQEVVRIAKITQPKFVIIENVVGLLSMKNDQNQNIKELIYDSFTNIGYKIEHKILNSADFGVPQSRKRVIFIASKNYNITFPEILLTRENYITVGDALGNLPSNTDFYTTPNTNFQILMSGRKDIQNHIRRTSNELVTKRMSFIPQGGNWQNIPAELGTGGGTHSNAYKRLDETKPSITIKHAAKAMIIHPTQNRILTVREVARLQSFNDNFILTGTLSEQHQQLANAVPPLLGKAIADEIYKTLTINSTSKFKFIDLFCGIGGFRLAFESLNGSCVLSSDIDKHAQNTYELNFKEKPLGDITQITKEQIPNFDILCAGFPCQPFSTAGKRKGFEDTRGTLFFEVARILKEKQPKAFLLENVKGLVSHNKGKTLQTIIDTLEQIGYDTKYEIINPIKIGFPQNRPRWYCIGFRKDLAINLDNFLFPNEKIYNINLDDIIKNSANEDYQISQICKNNIQKFIAKKNIKINKSTIAYEIRPSRCQFANSNYSPCLTAKMGTGGNNIPVVVIQNRKLTQNECLEIMGFPKQYKISKNYQSYKQIGNSVVVPVITQIAKEIIKKLQFF